MPNHDFRQLTRSGIFGIIRLLQLYSKKSCSSLLLDEKCTKKKSFGEHIGFPKHLNGIYFSIFLAFLALINLLFNSLLPILDLFSGSAFPIT